MNSGHLNKADDPPHSLSANKRSVLCLAWSIVLALVTSTVGYRIGDGWKLGSHIVTNKAYYIDLIWTWVLIAVVMETIYTITSYLDDKQPWREGYYVRMVVQVFAAILAMMFFMEVYDTMYRQITGRTLLRVNLNIFQIPFSLILPIIYSFYCCVESLKDEYFTLLMQIQQESTASAQGVNVVEEDVNNPIVAALHGQKVRLHDISIDLIVHFDGINTIYQEPDHFYKNNHTLSSLYNCMNRGQYKKTGRNTIVNRAVISGYHPRQGKGIVLELTKNYPEEVIVSKTEVDEFLSWFEDESFR